jgi:hypothetical protein
MGHDHLRGDEGSRISLLANDPSNECEGSPAKRDCPCEGEDASQGKKCPGPERSNPLMESIIHRDR